MTEQQSTYTTYDLADAIGKDTNAVRRYVKEFSDIKKGVNYFSDTATPAEGETRLFDDNDAAVIMLISQMKGARVSSAKIREALDRGDRGIWPPEAPSESRQEAHTAAGEAQPGEHGTQAAADDKDLQIAKLKVLAEALKDERDYLRSLVMTTQQQLADLTGQVVTRQAPAQIASGQEEDTDAGQVDETATEDAAQQKPLTWRQRIGRAISGDR